MSEPEITAKMFRSWIPVDLLGRDEQGRQLYRCPFAGCGETGYFDEDGVGRCPVHEAIAAGLNEAYETLKAALEPPGTAPEWARGHP